MACRELQITDYFRLTPTTGNLKPLIPVSSSKSKKSPRGFKPVVSVSIPNYRYYSSQVGRWLSRDPKFVEGSVAWNLFNRSSDIRYDIQIVSNFLEILDLILEASPGISKEKQQEFIDLRSYLEFKLLQETSGFQQNTYSFILNNPNKYWDALGLDVYGLYDKEATAHGHYAEMVTYTKNGVFYVTVYDYGGKVKCGSTKKTYNEKTKTFNSTDEGSQEEAFLKALAYLEQFHQYEALHRWKTDNAKSIKAKKAMDAAIEKTYYFDTHNCRHILQIGLDAAELKYYKSGSPKKAFQSEGGDPPSYGIEDNTKLLENARKQGFKLYAEEETEE